VCVCMCVCVCVCVCCRGLNNLRVREWLAASGLEYKQAYAKPVKVL